MFYFPPPIVNLVLFSQILLHARHIHHPALGDISKPILRYLLFFDEGNCVGALDTAFHSLGEAAYLISKIDASCILVLWVLP